MDGFQPAREQDSWSTLRGFKYQIDLSILRWLALQPDELLLQVGALLMPAQPAVRAKEPLSTWLELHAAISVVAYGAFALACVAGVMFWPERLGSNAVR